MGQPCVNHGSTWVTLAGMVVGLTKLTATGLMRRFHVYSYIYTLGLSARFALALAYGVIHEC